MVSVSKIAAMLAKATEQQQPMLPAMPNMAGTGHNTDGGRFARDPGEYARPSTTPTRTTPTSVQLTLIPGGDGHGSQGDHR